MRRESQAGWRVCVSGKDVFGCACVPSPRAQPLHVSAHYSSEWGWERLSVIIPEPTQATRCFPVPSRDSRQQDSISTLRLPSFSITCSSKLISLSCGSLSQLSQDEMFVIKTEKNCIMVIIIMMMIKSLAMVTARVSVHVHRFRYQHKNNRKPMKVNIESKSTRHIKYTVQMEMITLNTRTTKITHTVFKQLFFPSLSNKSSDSHLQYINFNFKIRDKRFILSPASHTHTFAVHEFCYLFTLTQHPN